MVILQVMVAILSFFFFFLEKLRHSYRNTSSNWTTDHNAPNVSENKSKHLERRDSGSYSRLGYPSQRLCGG